MISAGHELPNQDRNSSPEQRTGQRLDYLEKISGNGLSATSLFDRDGFAQPQFVELLKTLPLSVPETGEHLVDVLAVSGKVHLVAVEQALQAAFFKPNAARFSFEVAADGAPPSEIQLGAFRAFGLVDEIRVSKGSCYDTGVVFGGLLGAINMRSRFLLDQGAELKSVALLGGKRALIPERELGEALSKVIGAEYHQELIRNGQEPRTEYELMCVIWESLCRENSALRPIPVVAINSELRVNNVKVAPGTPDTVVDLANTLTNGSVLPGFEHAPSSFLLSSSQPHALRQREDFLSSMALIGYPGPMHVDVVGFGSAANSSLKLFAQEITKLVHAQYLARGIRDQN